MQLDIDNQEDYSPCDDGGMLGDDWKRTRPWLHYWHARRAFRTKLRGSKEANNQNEYRSLEAQSLIPDLELC